MSATSSTNHSRSKISVYLLAAPEDEKDCQAIQKYLTPVIRNSKIPIEIFSDFEIPVGSEKKEYQQKLFEADIVLAFISADYINDDDIYFRTQKVIDRYNREETIMLPILVRNCMWKSTPFINLPLLPKSIQPLNNKQFWNSEDDALTSVTTEISHAIMEFSNEGRSNSPVVEVQDTLEPNHIAAIEVAEPEVTPEKVAPVQTPKVERKKVKTRSSNVIEKDWRQGYYKKVLKKRGIAFLLDQVISFIPAYLLSLIVLVIIKEFLGLPEDVDSEIVIIFISYLFICAAFESSKWRGTFGKMIMKIQITDRDGSSISYGRAFIRNIFRLLVGYSYLFILPLIIQYFRFGKTKKLFHDQITSTVIGEKLTN
ncbi:MAG: RDD family protein [Saprospiraceae bacterium]